MLSPNLHSKLLKLRERVLGTMHPLRFEIQSAPNKTTADDKPTPCNWAPIQAPNPLKGRHPHELDQLKDVSYNL